MRVLAIVLILGACGQKPAEQAGEPLAGAGQPAMPATPVKQAAMLSVPEDPAQLKRIQAMGYTVHEDHLHAPGVSTCPKAGDDPVM